MKRFCFSIFLILVSGKMAFAVDLTDKNGTVGAQFLKIGVAARPSAMAGAFAAVSDDISAVYYNPSGLANLSSTQAMFTVIQLPAEIRYHFAAIATPIPSLRGVLGISFSALNSGDMKVTTPMKPFGTGENFNAADIAATITYALALSDRFSFGMTAKLLGLYSYGYSTHSVGFDIGTLYNTGYRNFRIGARMANFGPDLKFIDESFPMPMLLELGFAMDVISTHTLQLTPVLQGARINDSFENYSVGMECRLQNMFFLRAGYKWQNESERFSIGTGIVVPIRSKRLKFDYSFTEMSYLTDFQRFTLVCEL